MAQSPAGEIVRAVGGPGNIVSLTHCATRLRFQLVDSSVVDQNAVEQIDGVMGAVPQSGNRYQVVIGGAVATVFNEIQDLPEMQKGGATGGESDAEIMAATKAAARAHGPRGKFDWLDSLFEFLSDSFRPIIGALLGASLFITFMALMATLKVIPAWNAPGVTLSPSWQFVNLAWQSVFVFLPLYVAYNATKKVNADPWIGFAIMAVVMLPGFTALADDPGARTISFVAGNTVKIVEIFGVPLTVFNYSSQVFPPLLMAAVLGPLYKLLKKIIPSNVQLIFVPFLAMLVMIPLTAFLIGPIGVYAGAELASFLKAVNSFSPFIFAILIPMIYPFMVPLGLHWPINAIMLLNIQTLGYDFIQGPMGSWNFACFGATAGVLYLSIRDKDTRMRETSAGALAAGLLGGISEPSLYGIHLRFKRIYPRMLVGCFIGGLITGIGGGLHTSAFVFTSLLTIPAFNNIPLYSLSIAAAFFTAMILVIVTDYRTPEQKAAFYAARDAALVTAGAAPAAGSSDVNVTAEATTHAKAVKPAMVPGAVTRVTAPLAGKVVALEEVPDPAFAKGTLGKGIGIEPTGDTVVSPAPAKVLVAYPTGHAFGLRLDSGVELLIHIGIDTVNLEGKGFEVLVKQGDWVDTGTPLVHFDRHVIEEAGYSTVTPVVVTNSREFASVTSDAVGEIPVGAPLLTITAKQPATEPTATA